MLYIVFYIIITIKQISKFIDDKNLKLIVYQKNEHELSVSSQYLGPSSIGKTSTDLSIKSLTTLLAKFWQSFEPKIYQ